MREKPNQQRVSDIIARNDRLAMERLGWVDAWRRVADLFIPSQTNVGTPLGTSMERVVAGPQSRERYTVRYDSTAMSALGRLCAGIQALITPDNEQWHELRVDGFEDDNPGSENSRWLAKVNDLLFGVRYAPTSGFSTGNHLIGRSVGGFGTGVLMVLNGLDVPKPLAVRSARILYEFVPLNQCLLGQNAQGEHDTMHRRWWLEARVLAQRYGAENLSEATRKLLDDPKRMDDKVEIIHAIQPRDEYDDSFPTNAARNAAFASVIIEVKEKHLIREGGYFTFPAVVPRWELSEGSAYGESPCMLALEDVQGLNVMKRAALRGWQQHVDPPIGVAHDGVMARPNMNPGSINIGAVTPEGRPRVIPLMTQMNPGASMQILESERAQVKDMMLNNLFQILVENREMTAQEALIRAGEKADLLAPNGVTMGAAYGRMVEREIDILVQQGLYESDDYRPPQSMANKSFGFRSSNPLDRQRQSKKLTAMSAVFQTAQAAATMSQAPGLAEQFNLDDIIKTAVKVTGAPVSMLNSDEVKNQIRERNAAAAEQERQSALANQMADTANKATAPLEAMRNAVMPGGGAGV